MGGGCPGFVLGRIYFKIVAPPLGPDLLRHCLRYKRSTALLVENTVASHLPLLGKYVDEQNFGSRDPHLIRRGGHGNVVPLVFRGLSPRFISGAWVPLVRQGLRYLVLPANRRMIRPGTICGGARVSALILIGWYTFSGRGAPVLD